MTTPETSFSTSVAAQKIKEVVFWFVLFAAGLSLLVHGLAKLAELTRTNTKQSKKKKEKEKGKGKEKETETEKEAGKESKREENKEEEDVVIPENENIAKEKEKEKEDDANVEEEEEEEESGQFTLAAGVEKLKRWWHQLSPTMQRVALGGAFLVCFVTLFFFFLSSFGTSSNGEHDARPTGVDKGMGAPWAVDSGLLTWHYVRYYLPSAFGNKKRVPYIACHHYPAIGALHEHLLGSDPAAAPTGKATDLVTEYVRDDILERARRRCVIEPISVAPVDDHENHHDAHLKRLMVWHLEDMGLLPRRDWLADAPVTLMFLNQRGERFYRVVMVREKRLEPVLVSEAELLRAAENWHVNMVIFARLPHNRLLEDRPCLCDAHFGILASGLSFAYDQNKPKQAWSLRLDVDIARPLTQPGMGQPILYGKNIPFPYEVDQKFRSALGVGDPHKPAHHGRVEVTYLEPEAIVAQVKKRQLMVGLDEPNDDLGLAGVVDIAQVVQQSGPAASIVTRRQVTETENDCIHYCLELTAGLQRRFGKSDPGVSVAVSVSEGLDEL